MSIYLINGPSGSGKSTIKRELKRRGFCAIDTDEEFGYYANLETKAPVDFPGDKVTRGWYSKNGWIWNKVKVEKTLDTANEITFLCGGSLNESVFYPRFKKIFRLIIDADTLVDRLQSREGDEHTNNPEFIARMLRFLETSQVDGEKAGMIIIDTSEKSVGESVDELLSFIE